MLFRLQLLLHSRLFSILWTWLHLILLAQASSNLLSSGSTSETDKRGLIAIYSSESYTAHDLDTFTSPNSDLTWYYNYGASPTDALLSSRLEFVPMLAGPPGTGFASYISSLQTHGPNISYILFLNEPDQCGNGGVCLSPSDAAAIYSSQISMIKEAHPAILVSLPAVTGSPRGLLWLQDYFAVCAGSCQHDFVATHWYGPFPDMQLWINQMQTFVSNSTSGEMWVTEFAYPFVNLTQTQSFYNDSTVFLDSQVNISRYAYFGSFRSNASNIGPDSAMLNDNGQLTDIGSLYLGGTGNGVLPNTASKSKGVMDAFAMIFVVLTISALVQHGV